MLTQIQMTIAELQNALLETHPEMPILLRKIHSHLKDDPEIVTLLTEEEIATVINGLKVQTNVQFAAAKKTAGEKKASKSSASSRLNAILGKAGISEDDF